MRVILVVWIHNFHKPKENNFTNQFIYIIKKFFQGSFKDHMSNKYLHSFVLFQIKNWRGRIALKRLTGVKSTSIIYIDVLQFIFIYFEGLIPQLPAYLSCLTYGQHADSTYVGKSRVNRTWHGICRYTAAIGLKLGSEKQQQPDWTEACQSNSSCLSAATDGNKSLYWAYTLWVVQFWDFGFYCHLAAHGNIENTVTNETTESHTL